MRSPLARPRANLALGRAALALGRRFLGLAAGVALAGSVLGASCGQKAVSVLPGVVNDPKNLTLRKSILAYGTSTMCSEVQKRGLSLRMNDGEPAIGRFYVTTCFVQELVNQSLLLQFGGFGYAWTNVTKRAGFEASGAVEYEHDFLVDEGTMYVYLRERSTSALQFTPRFIEQPAVSLLAGLPLGGQTGAEQIGAGVMKTELARGFTVLRDDDGSVQFGLGLIEKGKRPAAPFAGGSGKLVLANERTEVHQDQRDYAGPFEVKGDGQALYLTASIDGAPAVDVMVLPRGAGDQWLQAYTRSAAPTPPPSTPILDEPVAAGLVFRRTVPVPEGLYYVVFDNTAAAGRTAPAGQAHDDRAALVSYAVEVGDAP